MPVLKTCCFWKDLRRGCVACGIYTLIYFGFSALMLLSFVHEEREYLFGKGQEPLVESILENGNISVASVRFHILFLICSVLMIFASILLISGIRCNKRQCLIPWIGLMLCELCIELGHFIHLLLANRVSFNPVVGFIFTIDFFMLCLNLYCLLCVISLYQKYMERHCVNRPPTSPIITFIATQKLNDSIETDSKQQTQRLLNASTLNSFQHPTNISTINDEIRHNKNKAQSARANV